MTRITTRALLCLLLPAGLGAQEIHITPFTARNGGLSAAPPLVGAAATWLPGPVGLRLGGAVDAPSTPVGPAFGYDRPAALEAWSADLDMVLSGARMGVRLGNVEPSLFVGFGAHGLRRDGGSTATIPVWSYGGGLATPLARWLSVDIEARYRMPHESRLERLPPDVGGGWEFRTGLSVRLGGPAGRHGPSRNAGLPGRLPSGAGDAGPAPVASAATAARTLRTADRYVGVPYRWGGETPSTGFDCSGFVQYVFARNGIRLPRVSRDQARAGWALPTGLRGLREGDLLFFAGADGVIDHVAIYVGDATIIHSSASRGAVGYDRLDSRRGRWYADHIVAARRVIRPGGPGLFTP